MDKLAVGYGISYDSVLEEPVEQQTTRSRTSSVEAEREFIEVVVQMLFAHCSLVCPEHPAFQERRHPMNARHQLVRRFSMLAQNRNMMRVAFCLDAVVA